MALNKSIYKSNFIENENNGFKKYLCICLNLILNSIASLLLNVFNFNYRLILIIHIYWHLYYTSNCSIAVVNRLIYGYGILHIFYIWEVVQVNYL